MMSAMLQLPIIACKLERVIELKSFKVDLLGNDAKFVVKKKLVLDYTKKGEKEKLKGRILTRVSLVLNGEEKLIVREVEVPAKLN